MLSAMDAALEDIRQALPTLRLLLSKRKEQQ
jgi:hypothetical protein